MYIPVSCVAAGARVPYQSDTTQRPVPTPPLNSPVLASLQMLQSHSSHPAGACPSAARPLRSGAVSRARLRSELLRCDRIHPPFQSCRCGGVCQIQRGVVTRDDPAHVDVATCCSTPYRESQHLCRRHGRRFGGRPRTADRLRRRNPRLVSTTRWNGRS